jgi:hypothetical protein
MRLLATLFLFFLVFSGAKANKMQTIWDETLNLEFINEMSLANSAPPLSNRLCQTSDQSGDLKTNTKTIRALLSPALKSISILEVGQFETHERFSLAHEAIADALQKSPKTLYRYEPWANAVKPEFVARLNYSDGKCGQFSMAYGYVCFQDESGLHWWTRFTVPNELNLTQVKGSLGFEPGHGYYVARPDGHRVWLQVTEAKVLVHDLQTLMGKSVIAEGEVRTVPMNVTMAIPSGSDYLLYGFSIRNAEPDRK